MTPRKQMPAAAKIVEFFEQNFGAKAGYVTQGEFKWGKLSTGNVVNMKHLIEQKEGDYNGKKTYWTVERRKAWAKRKSSMGTSV